jgi:hypothetical protein
MFREDSAVVMAASRADRSILAGRAVVTGAPGLSSGQEEPVEISRIPFGTTDWSAIEPTFHPGECGTATWRTREFGGIRVRMVEYSPGYVADHWCRKGHILLCLDGELQTELADGRTFVLTPGTSYQVADNAEAHRSRTTSGVRLFIVD